MKKSIPSKYKDINRQELNILIGLLQGYEIEVNAQTYRYCNKGDEVEEDGDQYWITDYDSLYVKALTSDGIFMAGFKHMKALGRL